MRYRSIHLCMWGDEKFRALSPLQPSGQALWIFLLTNPYTNNIPGLYRASEIMLADELGWTLEAFREAFAEVYREGCVRANFCAKIIYIRNAIKYNKPQSPNVVKSWGACWDELPECALKDEAYHDLKAFVEGLGKAYAEAFAKAIRKPYRKPMPNQEQEKEQEQDKKDIPHLREKSVDSAKPFVANKHLEFEEFWKTYPRKKDRLRAQKIWEEKNPVLEVLLADVEKRVRDDVTWRDKKFIPYPSTYLNSEMWLEEITVDNKIKPPAYRDFTAERLEKEKTRTGT